MQSQKGADTVILKIVNMFASEDQYFFLGDNSDNSLDSREWVTISAGDFVGEVVYGIQNPRYKMPRE